MKDFSKKSQLKKAEVSKNNLIKKIDATCSVAILRIDRNVPWDNPRCKGFLCNNHLFRRGLFNVRFHPLNCFCGTSGANYRHEQESGYMVNWFLSKYGQEIYQDLQRYSVGESKWSRQELEDILKFWETSLSLSVVNREWLARQYMKNFRTNDQENLITSFCKWVEKNEKKDN